MRYGKDIIRTITEELQKMPNIRYVCKRVGINHSTFYRWMDKHFEFHQAVEQALAIGRRNINDAAEAVIISGIQNQDFRSSTFWLTHNTGRYSKEQMHERLSRIEDKHLQFMRQKTPSDSQFERLFKQQYELQKVLGKKEAREYFEPVIDLYSFVDSNLKDVFYAAYEAWVDKQKNFIGPAQELIEEEHSFSMEDVDFPDHSVIHEDDGRNSESDSSSDNKADRES